MVCQALLTILNDVWWMSGKEAKTTLADTQQHKVDNRLRVHLSSCPLCHKSLLDLSHEVLTKDVLTCEECSLRIPGFYEEMHPVAKDVSLSSMPLITIIEVVIHLNACVSCRDSYTMLAKLWDEDLL